MHLFSVGSWLYISFDLEKAVGGCEIILKRIPWRRQRIGPITRYSIALKIICSPRFVYSLVNSQAFLQ